MNVLRSIEEKLPLSYPISLKGQQFNSKYFQCRIVVVCSFGLKEQQILHPLAIVTKFKTIMNPSKRMVYIYHLYLLVIMVLLLDYMS